MYPAGTNETASRKIRFSLRAIFLFVMGCAVLSAYVSVYLRLAQRGREQTGGVCFFYVEIGPDATMWRNTISVDGCSGQRTKSTIGSSEARDRAKGA